MQSDGQTEGVCDRADGASVPRTVHLGCHGWPLVRLVHSARTAPRPGWGHEQLVLIAACSDLQVVQLGQEATQRALFDAHHGPWSDRWLPAWLTPLLPDTHRGILLRAAQELDAQVATADPIPEVESTAQAVVRYTLLLSARHWAQGLRLPLQVEKLSALLGVQRTTVSRLWSGECGASLADEAELAARGLQRLHPGRWNDPPGTAPEARLAFERLGAAQPEDLRVGVRLTVWRRGRPTWHSTAAGSSRVARARRGVDPVPRLLVIPKPGPGTKPFVEALAVGRARHIRTLWQPLRQGAIRDDEMLLTGVVFDTDGEVLLRAVWTDSVIAVPLCRVVALQDAPRE